MTRAHMMITALSLVSLALAAPAPAQDVERGWTLVREDLELFIDPAAGTLRLEGTLVAVLDHDEQSLGPMLAMNARDQLMLFDEVHAPGAEVELNTRNPAVGEAVLAEVRYSEPKQRGDEVEISFVCSSQGQGRQFVVHDSIALASWVEAWYPIVPLPEGNSMSSATKVAGTVTFHMPFGWRAVTNGALVSSEVSDTGTVEVWQSDLALARSFAAGPYTVLEESVDGRDVSLYLLSDDIPDPRAHVRSLAVAIGAMEERWGPYPYPSYAIAEVPIDQGAFGASSEQGFIMVKPFFLQTPEGNLPLFAHEASHGWWGNTVGTDGPGSMLCSESLAQYGAVIAAEELWGKEGAAEFLRFSRPGYVPDQCARGYFGLMKHGGDKPLAELESGGSPDHTLSDSKGHWVFHMLRDRVGDETFFATLRGLIADYTGRTMTLDDVRARFSETAPDAELDIFFAQWLDRTGAPVLRHAWTQSGAELTVEIEQLQAGGAFDLMLDFGFALESGASTTERVHLDQSQQTFTFEAQEAVLDVRLDPQHRLLIWSPDYGTAPVAGLEDREPAPLAVDQIEVYAGGYLVTEAGMDVVVSEDEGHLTLSLGGEPPERLVHTGGPRFRTGDGFVVFHLGDDRAKSFVFVHDGGGVRFAVRQE